MMNNQIINIGDVCTYSYDNTNKSLSIVEVVEELSDECVVVKFHQVIFDDSGNDLFTYLRNTGKTMNVSRKYLTKIDLINQQKEKDRKLRREAIEDILEDIRDNYTICSLGNMGEKVVKLAVIEELAKERMG